MMNLNSKKAKNVGAVTHTHTHTHGILNKKEKINNNKNIYLCNKENCKGRCFCGFKKQTAITLIALIITIIVLLILAGVVLNTVLGDEGIIRKSQVATQKTNYKSAKEIVQMKLLEIQTNCVDEGKNYTLKEIATQMKDDEEILIEKYYTKDTAKVKSDIEQGLDDLLGGNSLSLSGIVVSVDSYESYKKYKFLIGESGEIKGVIEGKISNTTKEEEFKSLEQFEKEGFGEVVGEGTEKTEEIKITYRKLSVSDDKSKMTILITVTSNNGLSKVIKPNDEEIMPESDQNKIEFEETIEIGKDYKIRAQGIEGNETTKIINVNFTTEIATIEDLEEMKLNLDIDYSLKKDLDFNKRECYRTQERFDYYNEVQEVVNEGAFKVNSWDAIGNSSTPFNGEFNGNSHTISNIYSNNSNNYQGLFGVLGENAYVKNFSISGEMTCLELLGRNSW